MPKLNPILNPCGCGGEAIFVKETQNYTKVLYYVGCECCENITEEHEHPRFAYEEWNKICAYPIKWVEAKTEQGLIIAKT